MEEENQVKAKSKKGLLAIIAVIVILAIVAVAIYYFMVYTKPENVFKRAIGQSMQAYEVSIEESDYKTIKTRVGANVNIVPNEEDKETKEAIDFINELYLAVNVQVDNEQKQVVAKLESEYEDENLLNMDVYVDVEKEETYMYLKDLFNKYIEAEMDDESYEVLNELFENAYSKEQKVNLMKANKIMETEFKKVVKTEYCSSEKTENGTKNTISMTYNQLCDELITVFTNLKDNEKYVNCYENPEEVTETLEDIIESLQDSKDEKYDDLKINISIYKKGILQNITKVDFQVQQDDDTITMEITKKDKENYEVKISNGEETFTGNINIQKQDDKSTKLKIEIDVPEYGKVELNFDITTELNAEIDKADTSNSIAADEITQSDYKTILENLQKTKLYEIINKYSKKSISTTDLDGDEDEIQIEDEDEDKDESDEELKTKENEIISYNDEKKIEFNIANGYEISYKTDNYKSFMKDNVSVKISTQYDDVDEYLEDIDDTKKYYEEQESYKDVQLSDIKTIEVDGKEFSYKTLEYKYEGISTNYNYRNIYVCYKISDKNIVVVEVRDSGEMEESELKEFLKMTITDM